MTWLLQVIEPTDDGKMFDEEDAQLKLDAGVPRWEQRVGSSAMLESEGGCMNGW